MKSRWIVIVALAMISACSKAPPAGPAGGGIPARGGEIVDADLDLVRAWLKENTNDGKWEEVRWWPAREMVEWKEKQVKEQEGFVEQQIAKRNEADVELKATPSTDDKRHMREEHLKRQEEYLKKTSDALTRAREIKPVRLCRLKFRANNSAGAKAISDQIFLIADGKARPWSHEGVPPNHRFGQSPLEPLYRSDFKTEPYFSD